MDTPDEERKLFEHVTCNISASVDEVTVPGSLALDLIEQVYEVYDIQWFVKLFIIVYSFPRIVFSRLRSKLSGLIS